MALLQGWRCCVRVLGVPVAGGFRSGVHHAARVAATRRVLRMCGAVFWCAGLAGYFLSRGGFAGFRASRVEPRLGSNVGVLHELSATCGKRVFPTRLPSRRLLKSNAFWLLRAPANYFASPWPAGRTFSGQVVAIVVHRHHRQRNTAVHPRFRDSGPFRGFWRSM